ncbi:hypothetical protein ASPSYDRAFT_988242 [Aspergillus sydowii CBS 593.65]|uniref:Uncharacterized protein n=1 Tax=Aspergillus sydowii CBS 593.65 TaxID=1036612 RepID=A0A1L9THT5_9EURO|nr:uncharacterized protein ASPSYDRAFT_988242 [Aspergillus sydowii CBS 593.65]OJJ58986.1 hypothetical protein ASPSYDRAFT_988242 [Aspergillus sydowii CBS 593.65]
MASWVASMLHQAWTRNPLWRVLADIHFLTMTSSKTCATINSSSSWRNWLARLTVNQEVVSSSLTEDGFPFYPVYIYLYCINFFYSFHSISLSSLFLPWLRPSDSCLATIVQ